VNGEERLRAALRRVGARRAAVQAGGSGSGGPLKVDPCNGFEVAVAERLKALQQDVDELRSRLNWLLTVIVGAAVTNIVIALVK